MSTGSVNAYDRKPEVASPRNVEAWALMQSARELAQAKNQPNDINALRDAVRTNLILWTVFQDAVLDPNSPLPFEIRQNLLNLSRFIDKHSIAVLATEDYSKLDILININQNIAAGLSTVPGKGDQATNADSATPAQGGDTTVLVDT